jgi:hypothetical protein
MFVSQMDHHNYTFKKIFTSSIKESEKNDIIGFAGKICKHISASYIESRIPVYDLILVCQEGDHCTAIQFIHEFSCHGKRYYYLGPLFSHHAAFLPMFFSWLQHEMDNDKSSEFYLLAEFQSPEVFLVFKSLFYKYSYPTLTSQNIPEQIRQAASVFAEKIPHIHNLDLDVFSSTSKETFFIYKEKYKAITEWMESRGVFPSLGHNQLLLVFLLPDTRKLVMEDLKNIQKKTNDWNHFKEKMIADFEKRLKRHD